VNRVFVLIILVFSVLLFWGCTQTGNDGAQPAGGSTGSTNTASTKELAKVYMDAFSKGCSWSKVSKVSISSNQGDSEYNISPEGVFTRVSGEAASNEKIASSLLKTALCLGNSMATVWHYSVPTGQDVPPGQWVNTGNTVGGVIKFKISEKTVNGRTILVGESIAKSIDGKETTSVTEISRDTGLVTRLSSTKSDGTPNESNYVYTYK
jgi:hypothetical protein